MKNDKVPEVQIKFVNKFLSGYFSQYHQITNQLIEIILSFLFSSPFRHKNIFVLKNGTLLLKLNKKSFENTSQSNFILSNPNQQIIKVKRLVYLSQNDQLIVANKFHQNERIRISKIWQKPQTRTQQKILTYCAKFKQFLLGKHHQIKTLDLRYLKKQFLIPQFQKDEFYRHYKNIQENDAHFCSFDVLDSYMALVTKNYIEIQVQQNDFNDDHKKLYKIIPEKSDIDVLEGIKLVFIQNERKWMLQGENLIIWIQQKIFTRKKQLIRTLDGKVDLVEGNKIINVEEFQFLFDQNAHFT